MATNNSYYPILRARQFELIALRELAENDAIQNVTPIIEPVRTSYNGLNIAHKIIENAGQKVYLIVNPQVGNSDYNDSHLEYLSELESKTYLPAFHYSSNINIQDKIHKYGLNNCLLICDSNTDGEDANFRTLAQQQEVTKFGVYGNTGNRTLTRYLNELNKPCIRIDDLFKKEQRNSDYLAIQAHKFSEEHIYFKDEGFGGFSDYTVIPSEYSESGSTPMAVVIHLTYLKNKQIWIRHFTSTSNDSISNVQGKFEEAAIKAVDFCDRKGLKNLAIDELKILVNRQHYPGLGINKKIAIKNHILVVIECLQQVG